MGSATSFLHTNHLAALADGLKWPRVHVLHICVLMCVSIEVRRMNAHLAAHTTHIYMHTHMRTRACAHTHTIQAHRHTCMHLGRSE